MAAPELEAGYLSHPTDPPTLLSSYLSQSDELPNLLSGLKIARSITNAPAAPQHISHETRPGPPVITDAQIEAVIRARAEMIYRPVGTCGMGNDFSRYRTLRVLSVQWKG